MGDLLQFKRPEGKPPRVATPIEESYDQTKRKRAAYVLLGAFTLVVLTALGAAVLGMVAR